MRKQPHGITGIKLIAGHDRAAVSFDAVQEKELMNPHFSRDPGKEGEWEFDNGMESYKAADPRIHLFNGQCGMATAKGVYPSPGLNGIGHDLRRLTDVVQ